MVKIATIVGLVAIFVPPPASASSWPTHRHDSARSGYTDDPIDAAHLESAWVWRSPTPPNPAWDGPARWDAFAGIRDLPAMRQYDAAFHPVSDGRTVYFGSTSQDALFALDIATGKRKWVYVAGAPIRLAPTLWDDKVYFGCDDGFAYCLAADNGALIWRFSPSRAANAERRFVINNQRLISFCPIRTGVLIRDKRAYFGAALLPWREAFVCALDANNGTMDTEGTFLSPCPEATLEGTLLAADNRLIVPQGRVAPLLIDRRNGKQLGSLPGGGGVTIVIADDGAVLRAEGGKEARDGQIGVFDKHERAASFPRGRAMVVRPEVFYVIDDKQLFAANRNDNSLRWQLEMDEPLELIMAGDVLLVGCRDQVVAVDATRGEIVWRGAVEGRVFGLAVADNCLIASTDQGVIRLFAATASTPWKLPPQENDEPNSVVGDESFLDWGPVTRFVESSGVEVEYGTLDRLPTVLTVDTGVELRREASDTTTRHHRIRIDALPFRRQIQFQIHAGNQESDATTPIYLVDTHFNWTPPRPASTSAEITDVLASSPNPRGMAVVVGKSLTDTAHRLAKETELTVLHIVDDQATARAARQTALDGNASEFHYGPELAVTVAAADELPAAFASVVVAEKDSPLHRRLVRPDGGALWVDQQLAWVRPSLEQAGQWDHLYGRSDNSAFAGEHLSGATAREDLVLQWIGRPGPRYQTDRQNRKPSPLAAGGRLYMQGLQRMIALEAYSGSVLWTMETPTVMRWNVPHDCSNWCADNDGIYVAARDQAWAIDGSTGTFVHRYDIPKPSGPRGDFSWGYIARHRDQLLGTKVKSSAIYTDWWGGVNWFDTTEGEDTHVVAADQLFCLNLPTGNVGWTYDGLILHPTITILDDRVFFVEDRTDAHRSAAARRIPLDADQNHVLVCLDAGHGRKIWERPVADFAGRVSCLYLVGGRSKDASHLVLSASEATKQQIVVQCFQPDDGQVSWTKTVDWEANHHGKHISHPAIQGDLLYLRPEVLAIESGETLIRGFPEGHGCASYALCTQGLIGRLGSVTWWNPRNESVSRFPRVRTDCWISTVPALGMLISPEGGGGCSCGSWFETSLAFLPRQVDAQLPELP